MLNLWLFVLPSLVALQLSSGASAGVHHDFPRDSAPASSSVWANSSSTRAQSNALGGLILEGLGASATSESSLPSSFASGGDLNTGTSLGTPVVTPAGIVQTPPPNITVSNGSMPIAWTATGLADAKKCSASRSSWHWYTVSWWNSHGTTSYMSATSTNVVTNFTVATRTAKCPYSNNPLYGNMTWMVGTPSPVATWTSYLTLPSLTSTLFVPIPSESPKPCIVAPSGCDALWSAYARNRTYDNYPSETFLEECKNSANSSANVCGENAVTGCMLRATEVQLMYFPQTKTRNATIDTCATASITECPFGPTTAPNVGNNPYDGNPCRYGTNTSQPTVTTGLYVVSGGHTFFEGNAYLSFPAVSAVDCLGRVTHSVHRDVILTVASSDLYTYRGYKYAFSDAGYPFDFADITSVASDAWYAAIGGGPNQCSYYADAPWLHPNVLNGRQMAQNELCKTIFQPSYKPTLLLPPALKTIDPAFASCSLDLGGTFDPPIPLTPADVLAPQPTSTTADPVATSGPAAPASSPDSPDPTATASAAPVDDPDPSQTAADPSRPTTAQNVPTATASDPSDPADPADPGLGEIISGVVSEVTATAADPGAAPTAGAGGGQSGGDPQDGGGSSQNGGGSQSGGNSQNGGDPQDVSGDPGLGGIISQLASAAAAAAAGGQQQTGDPQVPAVVTFPISNNGDLPVVVTVGDQVISADPSNTAGGVVVGTDPVTAGAITNFGGVQVSVGSGGTVAIRGSTVVIPNPTAAPTAVANGDGRSGSDSIQRPPSPSPVTIGNTVVSPVDPSNGNSDANTGAGGGIVIGGSITLMQGASTVIDGTPIAIGSNYIVAGGGGDNNDPPSTIALFEPQFSATATTAPQQVNAQQTAAAADDDDTSPTTTSSTPVLVFITGGGKTWTATNWNNTVFVAGATLTPFGVEATLAPGVVVSVDAYGDVLVGGQAGRGGLAGLTTTLMLSSHGWTAAATSDAWPWSTEAATATAVGTGASAAATTGSSKSGGAAARGRGCGGVVFGVMVLVALVV